MDSASGAFELGEDVVDFAVPVCPVDRAISVLSRKVASVYWFVRCKQRAHPRGCIKTYTQNGGSQHAMVVFLFAARPVACVGEGCCVGRRCGHRMDPHLRTWEWVL